MTYAEIQPAMAYRITYTPSAKRGGKRRSRVTLTQRAAVKAVACLNLSYNAETLFPSQW